MQDSTAVSSAGPGRAVSHADASEPAQLRKRARSARAVDCGGEEPPLASASSIAETAAALASAAAWEITHCWAAIRKPLPSGLQPAHSAASSRLSALPFTVGRASWMRTRVRKKQRGVSDTKTNIINPHKTRRQPTAKS